jgi:GNAT superfamily N-acetyltransferase
VTREELRRRVVEGLEVEVALFGSCSEATLVARLPGVIASVSPPTADRSIFNSVTASGPEALAATAGDLGDLYREAGVRAWTVWVPDDDRPSAELLAARGHVLDGAPRAMALELSDLRPVELPAGVELVPGAIATIGAINDRAYGIEGPGWATAMVDEPDLAIESAIAVDDGEPVACALVLDHGDDACVSAVATLPGHRGRGLAGAIVSRLLTSAAERGIRTGSLQASRAGAPVYARLGFEDVGFFELWERREQPPGR